MIKEAWKESREAECVNCQSKTLTMGTILMQAVATSIDALAVGISFAVIHVNIFTACLLICGITFCLSLVGAAMGKRFGSMVRKSPGAGRRDFDFDRVADLCRAYVFLIRKKQVWKILLRESGFSQPGKNFSGQKLRRFAVGWNFLGEHRGVMAQP